jgi:phospholipid/cholesterol/gamma-HCH transport system substrate-binding protein
MKRRGNAVETLTGAVVILLAAGFLGYAVAHSGRSSAGGGYSLHATFDSIDGLGVGSDVKMAGVKIGSVTATGIDPKTFQAFLTLTVEDAIKLPKDSSASVVSESLLGGKYLQLQPGGDAALIPPGGEITVTQSSVNLEQLLGRFVFSAANLAAAAKPAEQGNGSSPGPGSIGGGPGVKP